MKAIFEGRGVLELGAGAAGPLASRYLAEQGARIVRVESRRRPDFLRLLHGSPDLDAAPMFALLNPDKQSVSLDLTHAEARELLERLVAWADVVIENYAPGVLERLGFSLQAWRERNPGLIVVRSCLFGQTGPQRDYPGFGGQGSAIAGFNHLTGWPDREALGPYATLTDSLTPRYVALLVAAALFERRRTGTGREIDVSQIEAGVYSLSEMIARASAGLDLPSRAGNRDAAGAPHGIFPCLGEDRWIAISVFDQVDWEACCRVLGAPQWRSDPRFERAEGRREHADALERAISERTRDFDAAELAQALQSAGVEAGPVQDFDDLLHDPQLAHRDHWVWRRHETLGELALERSGLRFSAAPGRLERAGPRLGEHTREILCDLLGYTPDQVGRWLEEGVFF